ncbi:septum formation initiator [Glycomyces halotolerans]
MIATAGAQTANTDHRPDAPAPRTGESLLVTADDRLAELVTALAAASDHPLRRVSDPAASEPHWQRAPLVIVGADIAAACLERGLPERRDLILCTTMAWIGSDPGDTSILWPIAIRLHADHVIALPEATDWLLDRFTRTTRDTTPAPTIAAVAGHGGAGASTLALAAATAAASEGRRVALIDLDLTGGGIDSAAGLAAQPGWRWPSLTAGTGQLEPERLLSGLPQRGGLHLIGPDPRNPEPVPAAALERVLHAARIAADLVVIDLPRQRTEAAVRAAAAARTAAVVLGPSQRAWEAARSVIAAYTAHTARLGMITRGRTGPRPEPAPDRTEPPVWGAVPADDRLPERLRQGKPPRSRTARRLHELIAELARARLDAAEPSASAPALDPAGAAR